ncbi:MBG domain-containing protein [Pseudomonas sp. NY15437]|uniref:MBG domain-containing protein n=1 Tax=Pseudomonas sp. NY15437 TaxID=3400360 RepID=UPI003A874E91
MKFLPSHTQPHTSCPSHLRVLCIAVALGSAGLPLTIMASDALPQGGSVVSGSGSITQNGAEMTVNTQGARTAINWQRFNVGPDNKITFNQPDGKSVTLNRVIGSDPSKIYGAVTSNGQLILVNPNGVWIGPKAHISSSALVASAGFLTEEQAKQFAETGKLDIQLTGNVTNQGRITVHDNGMVALLGAQVNNAGVIQARKGMVQLATGPQATLDFHGDGLLNIAVSGEPGEPGSVDSSVTGGVHNSGEIDVGNGTVAMSAARAAKHLDSVINVGGNVVADSVSTDGGTIVLGNSAQTNVTGNLSAKGVNGGQIKALGDEVNIAGSAKLDASGTQGAGGKVLVGGSYQGQGPEQAARNTTVAKGAQLKADGKTDGGQVVVWSDGKTHFAGSISAQGGQKGGDVETSGKQLTIAHEAQVNASGGKQPGKWLLDPDTVTVDSSGNPDTVSASAIVAGLRNNDVEITATNRINVNEAIVAQDAGYHVLKLMANGTAAPLSVYDDSQSPFNAAKRNDSGSVYINAPILLKNGHLFILATGDVVLKNNTPGATGDAGYMGRAIIDVSDGTIWIKTSNSASVLQDQGTALIGKNVAVQGSSVLLDSHLNYAGTLAGKATNGKFIYNQTSNGPVNTGKVQISQDGITQSMDGVTSETLSKVGEQTIWEPEGRVTHTLTLGDGTQFQYLVFEALGYVKKQTGEPVAGDTKNNDYWVSDLTFYNPSTGDTWKIGTDNSNGQIVVTRNGQPTTELPPGFSFGTNQGAVSTSQEGIGVIGGSGDQNNPNASNSINRNGVTGQSDQLIVDLGASTSSVDANLTELRNKGNEYQAGKITFLGGKDTTNSGGVQLGNQTSTLQGQVQDAHREYGDQNPTFSASVAPAGGNSDAFAVDQFVDRQLGQDRFAVTPSTAATEHSNVGTYTVDGKLNPEGIMADRHQASISAGTLTVTPAELTVRADNQTKTYGDKDNEFTYSVDGAKLGQDGKDLLNDGKLSRETGENVRPGGYGINQGDLDLNNGLGGNYTLKFIDGRLEIVPADLLLVAGSGSYVYDGTTHKIVNYDVSGLRNGDTIYAEVNGEGRNVGAYETFISNVMLSNGTLSNYNIHIRNGVLEITPAPLTITAGSGKYSYDGKHHTDSSFTVQGLVAGDAVGNVLFDPSSGGLNAGVYDNAIESAGVYSGGMDVASNYMITFVKGKITIVPADLTIKANDTGKIYGGEDPGLTWTVSGLVDGDSLSGALARQAGENVGKYDITQGSLGLAGDQAQNYILHFVNGTFTVSPATLTVEADGKTKFYGDFDPELTYKVSGLKGTDQESDVLHGNVVRQPGENAGTYSIDKGTLGLNDGIGQNYILEYKAGKFVITPVTLTAQANSQTKVYGEIDPTLSYTVSGLKGTDKEGDVLQGSLARQSGENVGSYGIQQGSVGLKDGAAGNYVLTFVDNQLAITPATLKVKADDQTKVYGEADPKLSHVISGLKYDDTEASVLKGALGREDGEDVRAGGYTIHQGSLGLNNGQGSNYILEFENGTLTVTPASLKVTANNDGKVYGELDPTLTFKVDGLKGADKATEALAGQLVRQAGEDVKGGGYAIDQGTLGLTGKAAQNYILTYESGTFNITPATLMVRADDKTKVYGEIDPTLSYQVTGFKHGEDQATIVTGNVARQAGEDVKTGGYAIGKGDLQSTSQNYILHYEDGTFTITPASLQIDFDDHSKVYGEIDPSLTYRVSGLKNGDSAASVISGSAGRAAGENVGNYAIGQGSLSSNGNYILTFNEGKLAITPAELTVTADHKTKVYGDLDPTLTYSVSGLKNGDSAASVTTGSLARVSGENVTPEGYAITQGNVTLTSGNYRMVFRDGNLQVTPAPLEVRANNQSKVQGAADPALSWSVSGLKAGDTAAIAQGSLQRAPGEDPGTYAISQNQAFSAGNNYTVTFKGGAMTITGPLAPVPPEQPGLPPLPMTAQSPGNARCTALESPSAASANYSVSPAVVRSYAVQLVCKPRSYEGQTSTTPDIRDVLTYANSLFKDGHFIVPEAKRSVIPHDLTPTTKGGK